MKEAKVCPREKEEINGQEVVIGMTIEGVGKAQLVRAVPNNDERSEGVPKRKRRNKWSKVEIVIIIVLL